MDLWKAAAVLPLRIHRSGVLLQGKCTALPAFSQSCPRVLTSAMEGELNSLLRDELLPLTLLGLQHKQTIESVLFNLLNDST